jgi:hypothetical protein
MKVEITLNKESSNIKSFQIESYDHLSCDDFVENLFNIALVSGYTFENIIDSFTEIAEQHRERFNQ